MSSNSPKSESKHLCIIFSSCQSSKYAILTCPINFLALNYPRNSFKYPYLHTCSPFSKKPETPSEKSGTPQIFYIQCVSLDSISFIIYPDIKATESTFSALMLYHFGFYFRITKQNQKIQRNTLCSKLLQVSSLCSKLLLYYILQLLLH